MNIDWVLTLRRLPTFCAFTVVLSLLPLLQADGIVVEGSNEHLRSGDTREWSSFPDEASGKLLVRTFVSKSGTKDWTLSLRQQDVKQAWDVLLNDQSLGQLVRDENDLRADYLVPANTVVDGENVLTIRANGRAESDDIRVGEIQLHHTDPETLRNGGTIEVILTDENDQPLAGRITIVDTKGVLMPVGARSGHTLAVRQGVVYTSTGRATFGVAPGWYQIFGGRGFEYSVPDTRLQIGAGQHTKRTLKLHREVDTEGWIACDTHVHTVTHSGHGDCTTQERMVTLAGEGIELPIATDHNEHIDYRPTASDEGVAAMLTPVIGNEVTTKNGHFNIFPVMVGSPVPDHTQNDWGKLLDDIYGTPNVRVAILNHARDIHSGFRPFSPRHHISLSGENLDASPQRFNAMELINSGAVQTDPQELFLDWCGLMNRGLTITPVGSSDSHDVARYIVGQGRTYIQCDDSDISQIKVSDAVDAFLAGRVVVCYGLFTKLSVNQLHGPGDLVTFDDDDDDLVFSIEVHGPAWTKVDSVELYVCGQRRFAQQVTKHSQQNASPKIKLSWRIPRSELEHDVWVTAIARGPGITAPYWKTAKPYQPDSSDFRPYVFSSTGPIRIDVDGQYTSPLQYADRIIHDWGDDTAALLESLQHYDVSVTHQAASRLRAAGIDLVELEGIAEGSVLKGIVQYRKAWRNSVNARLERIE